MKNASISFDPTPRLCGDVTPAMSREDAIRAAIAGLQTLLLAKDRDYGAVAARRPVLAPHLSARDAILIRMSDKINRINTLLTKEAAVVSESLNDTFLDLAGYAILYTITTEDTK